MTVKMWDSTTAADIPTEAEAVAGYISGSYAWSTDDWARFPTPFKLRIATSAGVEDGDVLDVEAGDATPAQAPGWITRARARGVSRPAIYCSLSTLPAVESYMQAAHESCDYWVAHWTGNPHLVERTFATQYADPLTTGGHYDWSELDETYFANQKGVKLVPELNPAVPIASLCVFTHPTKGAAAAAVAPNGAVYCDPPDAYLGGANGHTYFEGREAALIRAINGGYEILDTNSESYQYPNNL